MNALFIQIVLVFSGIAFVFRECDSEVVSWLSVALGAHEHKFVVLVIENRVDCRLGRNAYKSGRQSHVCVCVVMVVSCVVDMLKCDTT